MKVIVAGTRNFDNEELVHHILDVWKSEITEIVSGGAKGPDTFGETWASKNQIPIKEFLADWKTQGKSAGPIRNKRMALYADHLFAFWENKSKGTSNMIENMKELNKPVLVWENFNDSTVEELKKCGHKFRAKNHFFVPNK